MRRVGKVVLAGTLANRLQTTTRHVRNMRVSIFRRYVAGIVVIAAAGLLVSPHRAFAATTVKLQRGTRTTLSGHRLATP
jgi:hypothetical protein